MNETDLSKKACPECGEMFQMKHHLLRHQVKCYNYTPLFQCDRCSVILDDKEAVRRHLIKHDTKPAHKCKKCDGNFKSKASLMRHVRYKHTYEKPYKCHYCDYTCVEGSKMCVHERIHTGESPYSCSDCHMKFRSLASMKRHKAIHAGRSYICILCCKQFTISSTLKTHLVKIHAVESKCFDGIKNTKEHGFTVGLVKYLCLVLGYKVTEIESLSVLKYFAIKPEYANYIEHFSGVTEVLQDDLEANSVICLSDLDSEFINDILTKEITKSDSEGGQKVTTEEEDVEESASDIDDEEIEENEDEYMSSDKATPVSVQDSHLGIVRLDDLCVKLERGLNQRMEQLTRLQLGFYGQQPEVIKVQEDGTIVMVTHKYKTFIPTDI